MYRTLLWAVAPLLAAGTLLVQAAPSQAQWRGGWGNYYGGSWGYGPGFSVGYGPRYAYGYYPNAAYGYGYYPYTYGLSPYSPSLYPYNGTSAYYAAAPSSGYTSFYPAESGATDGNRVRVNLRVPADAKVTFDGAATTQTGTERQFVSPPLTAGSTYSYEIVAQWEENGQPQERKERVRVQAGEVVNLNMTQPRAAVAPRPAVVEPAERPAAAEPAAPPRPAVPRERNPLPEPRPKTVPEP